MRNSNDTTLEQKEYTMSEAITVADLLLLRIGMELGSARYYINLYDGKPTKIRYQVWDSEGAYEFEAWVDSIAASGMEIARAARDNARRYHRTIDISSQAS